MIQHPMAGGRIRAVWHPNIVAVHDRGEFESHLWIAMDYVDGTDAAQLVKDRYPAGMLIVEVETVCAVFEAPPAPASTPPHTGR